MTFVQEVHGTRHDLEKLGRHIAPTHLVLNSHASPAAGGVSFFIKREFATKFQCQCVFSGADGFAVFAAGQERVHDLVSVKLRGHAIDQLGLLGASDQLGDLQAGGHIAGIETARIGESKCAEIAGDDFI